MSYLASLRLHVAVVDTAAAAALLDVALAKQMEPAGPPSRLHSRAVTMRLSVKQNNALHAQYEQPLKAVPNPNSVITGLIEAARMQQLLAATDTQESSHGEVLDVLGTVVSATGRAHRPDQVRLSGAIANTLKRGGVLLAEAPTGSGKALAAVASALEALVGAHAQRVVIAVPTLQLMRQIRQEARRALDGLRSCPAAAAIDVVSVRGRSQFVSEQRLMDWASSDGIADELRAGVSQWIEQQVSCLPDDETPWSVDSLCSALPEAPQVALGYSIPPTNDRGAAAYAAQFERLRLPSSRLVICSHAMLAVHARLSAVRAAHLASRDGAGVSFGDYEEYRDAQAALGAESVNYAQWLVGALASYRDDEGLLPAFDGLIVDEAHDLERNVAGVSGFDLSIWALANERELSVATRRVLQDVFTRLQRFGERHDDDVAEVREFPELVGALKDALTVLQSSRKKSMAADAAGRVLTLALGAMARPNYICRVEFSPSRRFPRLRLGSKTVERQMAGIWGLARASIAMSATMVLPRVESPLGSDAYVRRLLQLPSSAKSLVLRGADWLYSPVTVRWPADPAFAPPDASSPSSIQWATEVGAFLAQKVWAQAAGGVLVLCTAYDAAAEMRSAAVAGGVTESQTILAKRALSLTRQRGLFQDAYVANGKALWFAVGGAWTGLDLSSPELLPADDTLLTDVVITRLPFGVNRTFTHEGRVARLGFAEEVQAMLLLLKQGIGRLVRRDGLPANRNIWLLDGRLLRPETKYSGAVRRLFDGYRVVT